MNNLNFNNVYLTEELKMKTIFLNKRTCIFHLSILLYLIQLFPSLSHPTFPFSLSSNFSLLSLIQLFPSLFQYPCFSKQVK